MRQLDLFSSLQSSTEGIDTEFKSAQGGLDGSFWESYAAFANTQGGTIVLGVAERRGEMVWEGVPDAAKIVSLHSSQKLEEDSPQCCCHSPQFARHSPQSSPQSGAGFRHLAEDSPHWHSELPSLHVRGKQAQ